MHTGAGQRPAVGIETLILSKRSCFGQRPPPVVITEAEAVIQTLVGIASQPKWELNELAKTTLTDRSVPDLILRFSLASQADLKGISRPAGNKCFEIVSRTVAEASRRLRDRIVRNGQILHAFGTRLTTLARAKRDASDGRTSSIRADS
jgi:hypothetical protein